jgi:hypothetical protein
MESTFSVTLLPFDRTLHAVQQQVESDLELVAKVAFGLHDSLGGQLREVGIFSGRGPPEYVVGDLRRVLRGVERRACFLHPVITTENPALRRQPSITSWWRNVAGPGADRDSIKPIAHR